MRCIHIDIMYKIILDLQQQIPPELHYSVYGLQILEL